jgi:hypothetical protein
MVEITYQMVLSTIQTVSLIIGVVYYIFIMRNSQKNQQMQLETRQSQLFMQLFQHHIDKERWKDAWTLTEMEWDDFDDFARKYDSSVNIENFALRYSHWYFWDGMGLLLKKGLVDREMIFYLMGGYGVVWDWEKFGSVIKEIRNRINLPDFCVWFEYLALEMMKVAEEKGRPWKAPDNLGILIPEKT